MCKQTIVERKETVEKLEETIEKEGADAPEGRFVGSLGLAKDVRPVHVPGAARTHTRAYAPGCSLQSSTG